MATLPAQIDVGPFIYDIADDAALIDKVSEPDDLLFGYTDFSALMIVVEPSQEDGQKRDTLMHETLHALVAMLGLDQDWGTKTEGYITRLSPALLALLRDNPDLVGYLTA